MTIARLHAADDVWLDRLPVPMTPGRAEANLSVLLNTLDTSPAGALTPEQHARLDNYILDTFAAYPGEAPGWFRTWRALHPDAGAPR